MSGILSIVTGCAPIVNATAKGAGSGFVYNAPNAAAAAAFEVVSESFNLDKKTACSLALLRNCRPPARLSLAR